MRLVLFLFLLMAGLAAQPAWSRSPQQAERTPDSDLTGRWVVAADFYGTRMYLSLELKQQGEKLTGNLDGDKLEGTRSGSSLHFVAKDEQGGSEEWQAELRNGALSGTMVLTNAGDAAHPTTHPFTATLALLSIEDI